MSFWIALTGLTLLAVALTVWPLLFARARARFAPPPPLSEQESHLAVLRDRRDEIERDRQAGRLSDTDAEQAQQELVDSLAESLDSRTPADQRARPAATLPIIALAFIVPAIALATYYYVGQPQVGAYLATNNPDQPPDAAELQRMLDDLAKHTRANPQDGQAWLTLAQVRRMQGDVPAAIVAYEKAVGLLPPDANTLSDYAELIARTQEGRLVGKPADLLLQALKLEPENLKVNALVGAVYMQSGEQHKALPYLKRFLASLDANSDHAEQIGALIAGIEKASPANAATTQNSAPAIDATTPNPLPATEASTAGNIRGQITLSGAPVPAGATLFIVARAAQGPRIPYAVIRQPAGAFPLTFEIGDANAMDPTRKLSAAEAVIIEARLSTSGQALRQAGDRFGTSAVVKPGAQNVAIQIDQQVP